MAQSIQLIGVDETLAQLRAVQPTVYNQMIADVKRIMQPTVTAIEDNIPTVSPLYSVKRGKSGMDHNGRSALVPVKVTPRVFPGGRASFGTEAKFVQIIAESTADKFGFEMIDMAGRGSGQGRRPASVTRAYPYKGGSRTHRLNGQGAAMIRKLNLKGKASRYTYPAAEGSFLKVQAQVLKTVDIAVGKINRRLGRI
jgi:hypothetical protein